jgi:trehalose utilization protein
LQHGRQYCRTSRWRRAALEREKRRRDKIKNKYNIMKGINKVEKIIENEMYGVMRK